MTTLARRARLYSQFGAALLVLWLLRRHRHRVMHWLQLAVLHGATAAVLALRALLHRVHLFLNWLLPKDFSVFVRRARLPHNRRRITDNRSYPAILTVDFDFPKAPPQRAKPTRRRQPAPVVCFSFAGCAWMLHYHFGAAMFLYDKVGPEWLSHCHFLGSSRCVAPPVAVALPAAACCCCHVTYTLPLVFRCSGSLIAACLACGERRISLRDAGGWRGGTSRGRTILRRRRVIACRAWPVRAVSSHGRHEGAPWRR